ncbi:MAG: hypothetical protein ASARMPREDX12_007652 [Alectoria sarmentosa]|nr:MAG: hypothetical protein ASARMPREDX12_007652 [Alectoria sarmentosa]
MGASEASTASSREPSEAANTNPPSSQISVEAESTASSSDTDDDSDPTPDTFKRLLENCLGNIQTTGTFATSGRLPDATLPGSKVHNVGSVGAPLAESQANAIRDLCHQVPFGQGELGSRTIVDNSIRRTWQLPPDQFELRYPKWPSVVQRVTEHEAQELGCTEAGSVNAQLYKLLLYEEGAMFKPHKDTEKVPGMFGTLVVCLPSEYEGGAVVASHRGDSKVFETASTFDHTHIAWYANVTHEVQAVTSRYRLVLTNNFIELSQGLQRSAALLTRKKRVVRGITSSWARSVENPASIAPNILAYKLGHEYTDASLKFQSLKGLDKSKAEYLQVACAKANACFHLASMERKVVGSCEEECSGYDLWERHRIPEMHTLDEITEQSIQLKRMIDLEGSVLAEETSSDEGHFVQEDPFERDPDTEDFEGFTSNEGASATQFYHNTVAVLIPMSSLARFLSSHVEKGIVNLNAWYERLLKKVQKDPDDEASRQGLYHLAILINQTLPRPQTPQTPQAQRRFYYCHRTD